MEKLHEEDLDEDEIHKDAAGFGSRSYGDPSIKRATGAGPYRLGKSIDLRDDLYSMIFASCVHAEYIQAADEEKEEKEKLMDEIIEDFKNEPNMQLTPYGVKTFPDRPKDPPPASAQEREDNYLASLKEVRRRLRYDKDNYLSQLMAVWLF